MRGSVLYTFLLLQNLPVSSITGVVIDKTLYAWLAVFVLPVNSALNPILYTLATKIFKQQVV